MYLNNWQVDNTDKEDYSNDEALYMCSITNSRNWKENPHSQYDRPKQNKAVNVCTREWFEATLNKISRSVLGRVTPRWLI